MKKPIERLRAWMTTNNYDEVSLSEALGYERVAKGYFDGRRHLGPSFQWQFRCAFGHDALLEVFGLDISDADCARGFQERVWCPDRYAAHRASRNAVGRGELPPAKFFKCHACDKPAVKHHHSSYHPGNHLCVTPLCESCHTKADRGSLNVIFGVVPTHVGLIRIAIACLT